MKGYSLRIFDSTESISLYNWTIANGLNTIVLTKTFDLYAAYFLNNQVLNYRPKIEQYTYHKLVC